MKPKKSRVFFQSIFLLSRVFLHFFFLLYSIDLCTSLIIKALMVLILFYVVVCSRCIVVEKRFLGFLQETSANFSWYTVYQFLDWVT